MIALLLSVVALFLGPLLLHWIRKSERLDDFLMGVLASSIGGIIVIQVLPECIKMSGYWVIIPALLGFFGPTLIEKAFHRFADTAHAVTLTIGLVGLGLHAGMDGVAIAMAEHSESMLSIAVVLHRILVGLMIWWLLRPYLGWNGAVGVLAIIAVLSVVGFYLAGEVMELRPGFIQALFEGFVAGTLLHVLLHRPHDHSQGRSHADAHAHAHSGGEPEPTEHSSGHTHTHAHRKPSLALLIPGLLCGLVILYFLTELHQYLH